VKRTNWLHLVRGSTRAIWKRNLLIALALASAVVGAALIFGVRASNSSAASNPMPVALSPTAQSASRSRVALNNRLSLQPQADRFRHRLGRRFLSAGQELSSLAGTLTVNGQSYPISILRRQDDDGERIAIRVGSGPQLTWNGAEGAKSDGREASTDELKLIERIALDSPDQFILAQLRGASYYTVAKRVIPEEALQSQDYDGPAWDVVRVAEPSRTGFTGPQSAWRMYCINTQTGLIDHIISSEQGEPLRAEFLDWRNPLGEIVPGRIKWTRNKQVIMEIVFTAVAYGSR
jgi:hypothetical protein